MPTRRQIEDEDDDTPRRRDPDERPRTNRGKKRRRNNNSGRVILLVALIGAGLVAVLTVGTILIVRGNASRTQGPDGGTANRSGSAPTVGPELVTNGGFEDGPEQDPAGPGFTTMVAGTTAIPGWTVTRGSVDYIGTYWQHAGGRRSVDLNGNEPGAIAQAIRTKPGRSYRVTFRLAGNCFVGGTGLRTVVVTTAPARTEFTFDATWRTYSDMGWTTKTWQFTATTAMTTLEFASTTTEMPSCGPALDGVSVVELGG
jgi:choice-of-anchor C domain-containing protein